MAILHYDVSAIFIFLVIITSMINRHVIKGHTNKTFFLLLISSLLATVADVFSELPINIPFRLFCNYIYHLLTILIPFLYIIYIYACIGLWHYLRQTKKNWIFLSLPFIIAFAVIISNLFTNSAFYITPEGDYGRGFLQPILLFCYFLYLFFGFCIIIKWHKIISHERRVPLLMLFPILIFAILFQQIHLGYEVIMFGLSIAELIIAFTIQRVDENFDYITGTKNLDSAIEDFQKIFLTNQISRVIFVKFSDPSTIRRLLGASGYNKLLKKLNLKMADIVEKQNRQSEIYYLHDGTFAIQIETEDFEKVKKISQNIAEDLKEVILIDKVSISLDARICVVRLPEDIDNLESFLNFRYNFHKKLPETQDAQYLADFIESKEFKIKNELDEIISRAITNHNFKMYYQPIYSVKEKKFVSAEALIRLIDDKYGFVSPALFIPSAETSGAIHQIGDYVIDSVCDFISKTDFEKLGLKYIELNLSVSQCIEMDLVEKFDKALKKHKIQPNQLNLEITESAETFDSYTLNKNINQLHQRGFEFSLDDYGTGYSNIKRLTQLPLEIVKLDKSFVDEMEEPQMWSVIVNTIRMFQELNKTILVEGIEDKKTLDTFENLGCEYIQGYYFSKPIPENEFIQFLKDHNS